MLIEIFDKHDKPHYVNGSHVVSIQTKGRAYSKDYTLFIETVNTREGADMCVLNFGTKAHLDGAICRIMHSSKEVR